MINAHLAATFPLSRLYGNQPSLPFHRFLLSQLPDLIVSCHQSKPAARRRFLCKSKEKTEKEAPDRRRPPISFPDLFLLGKQDFHHRLGFPLLLVASWIILPNLRREVAFRRFDLRQLFVRVELRKTGDVFIHLGVCWRLLYIGLRFWIGWGGVGFCARSWRRDVFIFASTSVLALL